LKFLLSAFDVSFGSGESLYFAKSVSAKTLLIVKSKKALRQTTSRAENLIYPAVLSVNLTYPLHPPH